MHLLQISLIFQWWLIIFLRHHWFPYKWFVFFRDMCQNVSEAKSDVVATIWQIRVYTIFVSIERGLHIVIIELRASLLFHRRNCSSLRFLLYGRKDSSQQTRKIYLEARWTPFTLKTGWSWESLRNRNTNKVWNWSLLLTIQTKVLVKVKPIIRYMHQAQRTD